MTPQETSRVEFIRDDVLVGNRVYRKGDVADILADLVPELTKNGCVKGSSAEPTDFDKKPSAKPSK